MSTVEILRQARELISDPEQWTQGAYCEDGKRWCGAGAILHVIGAPDYLSNFIPEGILNVLTRAYPPSGLGHLLRVNDDENHSAVLAVFDRAIELAEESS